MQHKYKALLAIALLIFIALSGKTSRFKGESRKRSLSSEQKNSEHGQGHHNLASKAHKNKEKDAATRTHTDSIHDIEDDMTDYLANGPHGINYPDLASMWEKSLKGEKRLKKAVKRSRKNEKELWKMAEATSDEDYEGEIGLGEEVVYWGDDDQGKSDRLGREEDREVELDLYEREFESNVWDEQERIKESMKKKQENERNAEKRSSKAKMPINKDKLQLTSDDDDLGYYEGHEEEECEHVRSCHWVLGPKKERILECKGELICV